MSSASSSGVDSRYRCTARSDESRTWLSRKRQRHCTSDNDDDMDSTCSATGAVGTVETNVDRPLATATHGMTVENPTPTVDEELEHEQSTNLSRYSDVHTGCGRHKNRFSMTIHPHSGTYTSERENPTPTRPQLVPEGRVSGRPSSPGAGSTLDLPDSADVGGESESSMCGDQSPNRRGRFDVDDATMCSSPASRRVDAGRRQRQPRPSQIYSTGPEYNRSPGSDRPHKRSVVYINMMAVSGGSGPSRTGLGRIGSGTGVKINSRERRAERTLIWVFLAFVVLWLPFFCTNLTYGLCGTCEVPDNMFIVFTWLGYLSSGVNPCIYTYLNSDFRKAFRNIVTCRSLSRSTRFPRQYS